MASVWNFIIFGYSCPHLFLITSTTLCGSCFPVCAVSDDAARHESELKLYELVLNPKSSDTCCSNTGVSSELLWIQIRTEFKPGFIHKVSSDLGSSASPSHGCSYVSATFLHLTSLDKFSGKFQIQPQQKKYSCLICLIPIFD